MGVRYGSLPFKEQIAFWRAKELVPTERWNDLVREQHDTAFTVAGAMQADLLSDLHQAVTKAIEQGTTLAEFTRDFEAIVAARGWTGWTGEDTQAGRAWRARVIYETNLHASYQAGRWAQVQAVKKFRPYLIYRHSDASIHPRELHVSWDGLVVAQDDPWVQTHWPPNGWGCKCRMFALSERDLRKLGKTGPDTPPDDGHYDWTDPKTGEIHRFPQGIDPFWDYAPGRSRADVVREQALRKAEGLPPAMGDELKAFLSSRDPLTDKYFNGRVEVRDPDGVMPKLGIDAAGAASMMGAPDGSVIELIAVDNAYEFEATGPLLQNAMLRHLQADVSGLVMHNDYFALEPAFRKQKIGTRSFAQQVATLATLGVVSIETYAAGSFEEKAYNGYYTWPRLGYDAPLTAQDIAALPPELRTARSVLDLMASEAGRAWWQTHGGPREMVFDLSAGSRSRRILQAYLENQGIRL
ncbi:phage head morphogenesis protein, SPP1 gp7 [Methylomicrobium album]|uniref:Phage head morphogenesis protein, SPP1 gp7 n=1 Tax=Methylomicrobium album BG8 TaxID=686340 RepID=H8GKK8_METAL|nr:phage head morphogenesis protein, SPP1 gp7 [Methylomicrobium album]EIC28016.1 phage head morphogenesis protein, SPP1 gp7 [Methylomicrobium album BG8]